MVDLLAVAATVSSLSLAAAATRRYGRLAARRSVPVLTWLTLTVLVLLEANAIATGNSQLALLLIADGLALWFALTVRGELLDARLTRLRRQRAAHRAQLRSSTYTQPGHVAPHRHLADRVVRPVSPSLAKETVMAEDNFEPAAVLQQAAAQLRADKHDTLAASLEQLGTHLSRQAAIQTEAMLAAGDLPPSGRPDQGHCQASAF